jgi:hypothetical protein
MLPFPETLILGKVAGIDAAVLLPTCSGGAGAPEALCELLAGPAGKERWTLCGADGLDTVQTCCQSREELHPCSACLTSWAGEAKV